jgi:predicted amidohydrolase
VYWDGIRFERAEAPAPRRVRVAAVRFRPRRLESREANVAAFVKLVDEKVDRADLVVLPEGMTVVGTGRSYVDIAEPVPGPTTESLGALARKKNAYIVAGLYERDGQAVYNTAVLIDRAGKLAGRYRKVYLPREEIEAGLTPGDDYPVFATDFGRLGLMICWDLQYADPARALALGRAEVIALPIWGGNTTLGRARAIENHVFLVSSGYDYPTEIVDPAGETVARAADEPGVAIAEIDLNRRYADPWLGHMRSRFFHELRTDVPAVARK